MMEKQRQQKFNVNDVLVLPTVSDRAGNDELIRFALPDHVGNRRFEVLLNIYRPKYSLALSRSDVDDQHFIVMTIADTICNRCKPRGRFFEKMPNDSGWNNLGFGISVQDVVRRALLHRPVTPLSVNDRKRRRKYDTGVIRMQESVESRSETIQNGRKRLRESAQLSQPAAVDFGFKHPCHRELPVLSNSKVQSTGISNSDVLCAVDGNDGNHILHPTECAVGNNRLRVMMRLRRERFLAATNQEERLDIVAEIVCLVRNESKPSSSSGSIPGRFLVENLKTRIWKEMTRESAVETIMTAMKSIAKEDVSILRTAALQSLMSRKQKKDSESRMKQEYVEQIQQRYRIPPRKPLGDKPDRPFRNASA